MHSKRLIVKNLPPDQKPSVEYCSDCLILTRDNLLMLQKHRIADYNPGLLHIFGGHGEDEETPEQTLIREIKEETGGRIDLTQACFLGAVFEEETSYELAVFVWFWHDREGTITGCYERSAQYFENAKDALAESELMEYSAWAIEQARTKNLIA